MVALLAIAILSAFDVPYSILIGLLTGVFNLIPTIGMFMNLGVAMFIFIFAPGSFWLHTLITTGMIAGLHAFNSYFVEPRFLGHRVGLHPVLLIASLFIFGYFLGFVGLLIAVPTTAIILMFLKEWYSHSVSTNQTVLTTAENPE
jgi:predicted PurR-regulated permease PerM